MVCPIKWPAAIFLNEVKKDISEKILRGDKYIFENIPVVHSPIDAQVFREGHRALSPCAVRV